MSDALPAPVDRHARGLRSLRLSVTDRCNLRCAYCMPEEEYAWLPRGDLLDFDELTRLAAVFARLGVDRLRLTGGEPLLRRDLDGLVRRLAAVPGVRDLALTTNGVQLAAQAERLAAAGLRRVTISCDTLDRERFRALTQRDALAATLAGLEAAAATFATVKLNTVVMRGVNDDELGALLELGRRRGAEVRFIEYMDVGGATRWSAERVVPRAEILARIAARYGEPRALDGEDAGEPGQARGSAPAERFRLPDGLVFGVIASTTAPFCGRCDRARLTADGKLFRCLYAREGFDLRAPLRAGEDDAALAARIAALWSARADRGAEERLGLRRQRRPLALADELRADPHLEMHTRGG